MVVKVAPHRHVSLSEIYLIIRYARLDVAPTASPGREEIFVCHPFKSRHVDDYCDRPLFENSDAFSDYFGTNYRALGLKR